MRDAVFIVAIHATSVLRLLGLAVRVPLSDRANSDCDWASWDAGHPACVFFLRAVEHQLTANNKKHMFSGSMPWRTFACFSRDAHTMSEGRTLPISEASGLYSFCAFQSAGTNRDALVQIGQRWHRGKEGLRDHQSLMARTSGHGIAFSCLTLSCPTAFKCG